jgi:hypothetical protein
VTHFYSICVIAIFLFGFCASARTQTVSDAQSFFTCSKVADDRARLECFDRVAKELVPVPRAIGPSTQKLELSVDELLARENALRRKETELASREKAIEETSLEQSPSNFGLNLHVGRPGELASFAATDVVERDSGGEIDSVESKIVSFDYNGDNRLIFILANGQVWKQTDGDRIHLASDDDAGNSVRLIRAMLGSYQGQFNHKARSVRVVRIDGKRK